MLLRIVLAFRVKMENMVGGIKSEIKSYAAGEFANET